jgi:phage shock protein C
MSEKRRLQKSRTDRMIDGVCGGTAEYFGVDPTLVRVAWVLLIFAGGIGVILYLAGMIIMPKEPVTVVPTVAAPPAIRNNKFWGILLVVIGSMWFLHNIGMHFWWQWWHLPWDVMLSVLLILAGVGFLFGGRNFLHTSAPAEGAPDPGGAPMEPPPSPAVRPRLLKSRADRKLFGVCGGLGVYFDIDPTLVRILFVLGAIASVGFAFLFYVIMAIVVPNAPLVVVEK